MREEKRYVDQELLFTAIHETLKEGYQASFTVTGMSMWPFLAHGRDSVVLEAAECSELKCGDVVLFKVPVYNNYILHRITKIKGDTFQTTGDGNCHRDGWYPLSCVEAKAVKFIRKGNTLNCDDMVWRVIFSLWNMLFPARSFMLVVLKAVSGFKKRIGKK